MQPIQNAPYSPDAPSERHSASQFSQADRFQMLVAASEAEEIAPIWLAEQLSEPEQVAS